MQESQNQIIYQVSTIWVYEKKISKGRKYLGVNLNGPTH